MTRGEAEARADALNAEHRDRDRFRWVAHDAAGQWSVVRIPLSKPAVRERLTTSDPGKQPTPPDERPLDLPGGVPPWAAGGG